MYEILLEFLKNYLSTHVNAVQHKQVDYYGNMALINFAAPGILIEPLDETSADESSRWKHATFNVRIWILVAYDLDYMGAFGSTQKLLTAADDDSEIYGIKGALMKMKRDDSYLALEGSMAGKKWRIHAEALDLGRTRFGVTQRASTKLNTATQDLQLHIQIER